MIETIKIKGMHCVSCENRVKEAISNIHGVKDTKIDYTTEKATIDFDQTKTDIKNIMRVIKNVGYEPELSQEKKSKDFFKKLF
jgi:copper chaperone CopZ